MSKAHAYNYTYVPPLAFIDRVPGLGFTLEWALKVIVQLLRVVINAVANRLDEALDGLAEDVEKAAVDVDQGDAPGAMLRITAILAQLAVKDTDLAQAHADFRSLASKQSFLETEALRIIKRLCAKIAAVDAAAEFTSLADYNAMFKTIALPPIARTFQQDATFADMRVAGPNPMVLARLTAPMPNFSVTNAMYQAVLGDDESLDEAIAAGRVYVADYALLNGALAGSFPTDEKFMAAPIALFGVPKSGPAPRKLAPVAIQCQQQPGANNPIFQPPMSGGDTQAKVNWLMAKTVVQTADGNYHEAISHLGQTHLVVEPFVVATLNNLSADHPVGQLLTPHFEGTLLINNLAQSSLIAAGGTVDTVMQGTIDQDRVLAALGTQAILRDFNNNGPIESLTQRGVDDSEALPYYPYRDSAKAVFAAIESWVKGYVGVYYPNENDPAADAPLQAWVAELVAHDGGRLLNLGDQPCAEPAAIHTASYLAALLAKVIFIGSAQHAAVNFPQKSVMSYTPAMPLAGYAPPPDGRTVDESDWFALLPKKPPTSSQLNIGQLLGGVYYTQLGQYGNDYFDNVQVQALVADFQAALAKIDSDLANQFPDYPYLRPGQVPQSVNI